MFPSYRLAIADDNDSDRELLREALLDIGHDVVVQASTGEELVSLCTEVSWDEVQLVVADFGLEPTLGRSAAELISARRDLPFVMVSTGESGVAVERAAELQAFGYLSKPLRTLELQAAVHFAMQQWEELQLYRHEVSSLKQALEDRKLIERAKGIVMRTTGLDEASALRRMQQLARRRREKLTEIAHTMNLAEHSLVRS